MNRVAKVVFVAAASLAVGVGTAVADDPPAGGEGGEEGSDASGGGEEGGSGSAEAGGGGDTASVSSAYTKDTWPTAYVDRPVTLAAGMIQIHADFFGNLGADAVFKPFGLAPDVHYGVNDKLTVGLVHGRSLCLAGEENGCAKLYDDVGLDVLFGLSRNAKMDLAAHVGVNVISLDAGTYGLRAGVLLKYQMDKLGIYADPGIGIGITDRDAGNKEYLSLPIMVAYQVNGNLAPFVRTGIGGASLSAISTEYNGAANLDVDGAGFGDTFTIPLGVGAIYGVSNKLDVGAEFDFPGVAGSDAASTDNRYFLVSANLRL
jgi:opacity protein-like surface antigen